jgi:SsrA-binding protein
MATKGDGRTIVASNRRARHDYELLDVVEAGLVLKGSEVKSLREGKAQIADGYAAVEGGEMYLHSLHIPPYSFAVGYGGHDPDRRRKLLLHRAEIERLGARVAQDRLTLVPLAVYFKDGRAKVEIALARGRKVHDKRQAIAQRDVELELRKLRGRSAKGII